MISEVGMLSNHLFSLFNLLHGFSGLLHLVFLLVLLFPWLCKIYRRNLNINIASLTYSGHALFCSLVALLLNIVLCLMNKFYWCRNGWSELKILVLLDSGSKALVLLAISVFLHAQVPNLSNVKYPLVIRVWWCFFITMSCYCIGIDYVYYKIGQPLPLQCVVSDALYIVIGLFLCCAGLFSKNELLQEPLSSADSSRLTNGEKSKESGGGENVTPYASASIFSILTFSWIGSLIALGYRKTLDLEDVPQVASIDSVKGTFPLLIDKLGYGRDNNNSVTTIKLAKALIFTMWKEILLTAFLAMINALASYVGPYLIDIFVQYLNGHQDFRKEGYIIVFVFIIAKVIECLAQRHWFFKVQQVGTRGKAALIALIYHKGLTLSCKSKQGHTSGDIINIMTVDAERIGMFGWFMHDPWLVIVQVGLALVILYKNLGLASVATLVVTVIVMLANVPLGILQENFQTKLMKFKDHRMKATSEILRNMRILKLQCWEMKFLSKIVDLRDIETRWLRKFVYTNAIVTFVFWGTPTFVAVVTFCTCIFLGIPLESGNILSALATFRLLQVPIYNLPEMISMITQTKVSLDRISSFLSVDDLQTDVIERVERGSSDIAVEIINGTFSWDACSFNPTLKDIKFLVSHGMRVAVCGMVGSGKSSLLSCILGEVPKISGVIKMSGTRAYVAQTPWIQSGKIVENVLFGKEMDRVWYEKVLEACCLRQDLEILPFGDQTVVGERGINLSGGQKQRIQIARALYQNADIYLFDDPFSVVDAHTGSWLFRECLLGLLESKTVIYVTHQVEFLPAADLILVMKDGRITQSGKYDDMLNFGSDFSELVGAHKKALSGLDSLDSGTASKSFNIGKNCNTGSCQTSEQTIDVQSSKPVDGRAGPTGQLVQEEERVKGRVRFSVYWKYITTAFGGALIPVILLAQVFFQILQMGSSYWIAWATPVLGSVASPVELSTLLIVYGVLAMGSSFCILVRSLSLATAGYKTATLLFYKMHSCIFRAPMSFFDSTPSGRILTRASTDQSTVDLDMPNQVGTFAFSVMQLIGIIAVMLQVTWQAVLIFVPVIAICIWLQHYYLPSARELARLVGVHKTPVIQHFAETISGSTTIRSFDQECRFQETNMKLIDGSSKPKFHSFGAREWLTLRLDIVSSLTFAFLLVFLISAPHGIIDPNIAGLAIVYGLSLNQLQASVIWSLCNLENKIISVERMLQYSCITSDPPLVIESNRPADKWPFCGEVDICNLQVRYAPHMPLVLRGLTCTFKGGKKTGIVGRTGSGKSTLVQTIFRVVEPTAGKISIDGIDICLLGLHDLRSRLSIIPQDPTMFEGTLRSNLDPLEEYTNEQIWEVLNKCHLVDEACKKEGILDSTVSENGKNWSVGQRQLVCLGRVLLKKSKVLVLDEATASVDTATDNMIQQTLREHFSDSTILTIAHRMNSVLDSDMVLLLKNGILEEYDSPTKLLMNKTSSFSKIVAEYTVRSNLSVGKTDVLACTLLK